MHAYKEFDTTYLLDMIPIRDVIEYYSYKLISEYASKKRWTG